MTPEELCHILSQLFQPDTEVVKQATNTLKVYFKEVEALDHIHIDSGIEWRFIPTEHNGKSDGTVYVLFSVPTGKSRHVAERGILHCRISKYDYGKRGTTMVQE